MPRKANAALSFISLLTMISSTAMAESALRVSCEGSDRGSKIYINGQYKADCPSDLFVAAGNIKLRVVKPVNSEYEKVYEQEFYLADDSAKRIDVQLSAPTLTAAAVKERVLRKQKQEKEAAEAALERAKKGDISAMWTVSQYYANGTGVPKNTRSAIYWRKMAEDTEARNTAIATKEKAKSGDIEAMRKMAQLYAHGTGVIQDKQQAKEWEDRADSHTAKAALESAEKGNIAAMRDISRYYAEGKGVVRNLEESEKWENKAQQTDEENARKQRKLEDYVQAKKELNEIDFLEYTKVTWDTGNEAINNAGAAGLTSLTFLPVTTMVGMVTDLTSVPTKSYKMIALKNRISSRPSTFGKPNSMIAQVFNKNIQN